MRLVLVTNSIHVGKEARDAITRHLKEKTWSVWHWFEDLWLVTDAPANLDLSALRDEILALPGVDRQSSEFLILKAERGLAGRVAPPSAQWIRENWHSASTYIHEYVEEDKTTDYQRVGNNSIRLNTQTGQMLTHCTDIIQQAPANRKSLLEELDKEVAELVRVLPEDQRANAVKNYGALVKEATSAKPDRRWYSVSIEGLLEAAKFVKEFSGNTSRTLLNLGKTVWGADYKLPSLPEEPKDSDCR